MNDNIEIMDSLLDAAVQTPIWDKILEDDPHISAERSELENAIDQALATQEARDEMWSAIYRYTLACEYAAILYGMRILDAFRMVSANPFPLTQYILEHTKGVRGEV